MQKKCRLSTSKTLHSGKWQNSQIVIFRSLKKCDEQNELIEDDSDNIMNINESEFKAVRFEEFVVKDKKRVRDDNESIVSKIKNVKLADVFCRMMKQNSTHVIQKILCAVVSNITVENILISESVAHKLMFKSEKSDLMIKIFETERINVNSVKIHCIMNILYFSVSSCAVVNIEDE